MNSRIIQVLLERFMLSKLLVFFIHLFVLFKLYLLLRDLLVIINRIKYDFSI